MMERNGIGIRLREERRNLALSQAAFSELAGTSKPSQVRYEHGARSPDAKYISAIEAHGVDVLYIITGRRECVRKAVEHQAAQLLPKKGFAAPESGVAGQSGGFFKVPESHFVRRRQNNVKRAQEILGIIEQFVLARLAAGEDEVPDCGAERLSILLFGK